MVGRGRSSRLKQTDIQEKKATFGRGTAYASCARNESLQQNVNNQNCATAFYQQLGTKLTNENIFRVSEQELIKELSARRPPLASSETSTMLQNMEKMTKPPKQCSKNPTLTQYIQSHHESVFGSPKNKECNPEEHRGFSNGHLGVKSRYPFNQDRPNIPSSFAGSKYDRRKFKWVSPNLKGNSQFGMDINKEALKTPPMMKSRNDLDDCALSDSATSKSGSVKSSDSCNENSLEYSEEEAELQEDHFCDSFIRSPSLVQNRKLKEGVIRVEDLEKGCDEDILVSNFSVQEDWEEEIEREEMLRKERGAMKYAEELNEGENTNMNGVSIGRTLLEMISNPTKEETETPQIQEKMDKIITERLDEENLIDKSHSDISKTDESSDDDDFSKDVHSDDSTTEEKSFIEDESCSESDHDDTADDDHDDEHRDVNNHNCSNGDSISDGDDIISDKDYNDDRRRVSRKRRRRRSKESVAEDTICEIAKADEIAIESIVSTKKQIQQKSKRKELYIPFERAPRFERRQWKPTKLYNWRTNRVEVIHHCKNQKYFCKESNIRPLNKPNQLSSPKKPPTQQSKKRIDTDKGFVMPLDFPPIMKAAKKADTVVEKCVPNKSVPKSKLSSMDASRLTAEQVSLSVSKNMINMVKELERLNGEIRESLVSVPSFAEVSKGIKNVEGEENGVSRNNANRELNKSRKYQKHDVPKTEQNGHSITDGTYLSNEQLDNREQNREHNHIAEVEDVALARNKPNEETNRIDIPLSVSYGHTNLLGQTKKVTQDADCSPTMTTMTTTKSEKENEVVIARYEHPPAITESSILNLLDDESFHEEEMGHKITEHATGDHQIYEMEIKDDVMMMQALTIEGDSKELTDRIDQSYGVFKNHWSPDEDDKMFWIDFSNQLKQDQEILILNEKHVPKSLSKEKICTKNCYFDTGKKLHLCSPESIKC